MVVKQVFQFANDATAEATGQEGLLKEDLSNVVAVGDTIENTVGYDKYCGALINRIGRTICVDRIYRGRAPKVLMSGWEFGSVLQKIRTTLPAAEENEGWSLEDGQVVEQQQFYKPAVFASYWNQKVTFQIPISICTIQIKQSFLSPEAMNAFISMIYTSIENSMTIKLDAFIMRTINNMVGETAYAEVPGGTYTGRTGVKAINLLYEYNQQFGTSLTAAAALTTPEFLKFATMRIALVADRMETMSTLFNVGGTEKFTPKDVRHFVVLSEFARAIGPYSLAPAYNEEWLKLPEAETVAFWQGSGTDYGFSNTSQIKITTASGHDVTISGVLAVMFDRDACAVCNKDRRTTSAYNAKGEFTNFWFKADCENVNDSNENFVFFYVA